MFETILVPTDGSEHAAKAIDLAAGIAGKFEGKIVLLHILLRHSSLAELEALCERMNAPPELIKKLTNIEDFIVNTTTFEYGPVPVVVPTDILEEIGYMIGDNAKQLAAEKGVGNFEVHVRDGAPADIILAAAEHEKADMIVMGSRGLGHLTGMLMGSVSHKVNHLSECTCITVK